MAGEIVVETTGILDVTTDDATAGVDVTAGGAGADTTAVPRVLLWWTAAAAIATVDK